MSDLRKVWMVRQQEGVNYDDRPSTVGLYDSLEKAMAAIERIKESEAAKEKPNSCTWEHFVHHDGQTWTKHVGEYEEGYLFLTAWDVQ